MNNVSKSIDTILNDYKEKVIISTYARTTFNKRIIWDKLGPNSLDSFRMDLILDIIK